MCGISGFFSDMKEIVVGSKYYQAHALLNHRGPDDEGFVALEEKQMKFFCGNRTVAAWKRDNHIDSLKFSKLVLGQSRLSIIDLSSKGHQPMKDESGRYYMIYNGEIYNYKEIRGDLLKLGDTFNTDSDTEVVLKAIRHWGQDAFQKFNGMWAIAFFDSQEQSLLLSRDRFGIKPLYYSYHNDVLYFASEIKFLKSFCDKNFKLNVNSINNYLDKCLLNGDNHTFWEEIQEVEPGHNLIFHNRVISKKKYWDFYPKKINRSLEDAVEEFSAIFSDAVKLRMRSDVAVGASLSGGLDSTLIVAELFKQKMTKYNEFKTFSIVFDDEEFSEKKYIEETVKNFNLDAHYIYPNVDLLKTDIDEMMQYLEEPFRSLSTYSLFLIYQYVRKNTDVKVVLNGQGSDEAFGGYTNHYFQSFAEMLKKGQLSSLTNEINLFTRNRQFSLNKTILYTMICFVKMVLHHSDFEQEAFKGIKQYSLREYLRYDDRLSMAAGIETRAPFMDYRLIEFAFSLGRELKVKNFENKIVPRQYATNMIPNIILKRRDKMGFISPQEKWQKQELKEYMENNFKGLMVKLRNGLLDDHIKLHKNMNEMSGDKNWRFVCFNRWLEVHKIT